MDTIKISTMPEPSSPQQHIPGEPLIQAPADTTENATREPNYSLRRKVAAGALVTVAGAGLVAGSEAIDLAPKAPLAVSVEWAKENGLHLPAGFEENPGEFTLRGGEIVPKD